MTGSPNAPPPQPLPTSSTTVSEFPEFAQPAAEDLLSRASALSQSPLQPGLPGAGQRLQGFSPEQEAAFGQLTQRGLFGSPLTNAAQGATFNQLTTDPTQNPLVDRLVGTAQGDIVDQFNLNVAPSLAARNKLSGSFGNTGLQETEAAQRFSLARALGDVESQIRLPAFESQSQRQLQAAQLSPLLANQRLQDITGLLGVGQSRQQFGQAGRDIEFSNLLQQREEPLQQLDILARALGAVTAGGNLGTRTQTGTQFFQPQPGQNELLGILGAGGSFLGGAGLLASGLSDKRLKKDIRDLDRPLDTLLELRGVEFEFDHEELPEGKQIGFIAQEVEEVIPEWVGEQNGHKHLKIKGFEALAVEAIRELKEQISELQEKSHG